MLWITLHNRLGKQPIRNVRDRHVMAVIDGKQVFLDLKFRCDGTPYFVKADGKSKRFEVGDRVYNRKTWRHGIIAELTPDVNQVFVSYLPRENYPDDKYLTPIKYLELEGEQ